MIRALLFDLDGVLLDTNDMHRACLHRAVCESGYSSLADLLPNNQMTSREKLKCLNEIGLPADLNEIIIHNKHNLSQSWIETNVKSDNDLVNMFARFHIDGIRTCIVTNTNLDFVKSWQHQVGLDGLIDVIVSNDDVRNHKPHPDPYLLALKRLCLSRDDAVVFEDSLEGLKSACSAGLRVVHIQRQQRIIEHVKTTLRKSRESWNIFAPDLRVLVPMAGEGSRFRQAGYDIPKPFIEVLGMPMVNLVISRLPVMGQNIFIARTNMTPDCDDRLRRIDDMCQVVYVDRLTEGAACTVLLAKDIINDDDPLMIVNSDNIVTFNYIELIEKTHELNAASAIMTFKGSGPKWSYSRVNDEGYVIETAEKRQICDDATSGVYFFQRGRDFVKYAQMMIEKNIRVNNEFYVCPVYNQLIDDGQKVINLSSTFDSLGTPEDLDNFLKLGDR